MTIELLKLLDTIAEGKVRSREVWRWLILANNVIVSNNYVIVTRIRKRHGEYY